MTTSARLRVAVAQTEGVLGDLDQNLQQHLALIDQARQQKVELLVFPELSLTGYALGSAVLQVACRRGDARLLELAKAAGGMTAAFGFVEEGPGAQFFNSTALVRDGEIRFVHRKINLPNYGRLEEGKLFAGAQHVATCPINDCWTAGVLICADLWNPALVHLAMLRGATVLLAPINSALGAVGGGFSNPEGWELALRFYAMMYGTPVLMANRVGREGEAQFWGGSRILGPRGECLAQVPDEKAGLVWADLDYAEVRRARFVLPTLRDSHPALIASELQEILDSAPAEFPRLPGQPNDRQPTSHEEHKQ